MLNALRGLGEEGDAFVAALEADKASPQPLQERDAL